MAAEPIESFSASTPDAISAREDSSCPLFFYYEIRKI